MSIAAAFAADKEPVFRAPSAAELSHRQTNGQVTIGADPYMYGDKVKAAFGKLVPYSYGVLPILVVIQNDSGQTIRLEKLKAEYVGPRGYRVSATPASEVRYANGAQRPPVVPAPPPLPGRSRKNPLNAWEIEGRAFAAKMLPTGNNASGFLYFEAHLEPGATLYLSGLTEAATGKELFYFEIPLD